MLTIKRIYVLMIIFCVVLILLNWIIPRLFLLRKTTVIINDKAKAGTIESILNKECSPILFNISEKCLNSLKKIDQYETSKIINGQKLNQNFKSRKILKYYHVFLAKIKKRTNLERLLRLHIMTFLATQNLYETKLILWKLENFPQYLENRINKTFKFYFDFSIIQLKKFDINEFCTTDSLLERSGNCIDKVNINNHFVKLNSVILNDFVKFMVLLKYGGIYTDVDTIYLRNLKPLWNLNFAFRWSYRDFLNAAIIGINNVNDKSLKKLIQTLTYNSSSINSILISFRSKKISSAIASLNYNNIYNFTSLNVLHSCLFDPAILCADQQEQQYNPLYNCKLEDFSERKFLNKKEFDPKKYFEGAFTYHIHSGSVGFNILSESYFSHFENYYKNLLKI